jgi:hypothetical protein
MEPLCVHCERTIPLDAAEFDACIWREDEQGEVVGVICPNCQTDEERAAVRERNSNA